MRATHLEKSSPVRPRWVNASLFLLFATPAFAQLCGPQIGDPPDQPPVPGGSVTPGGDFKVRCIQTRCNFVADTFQTAAEADIQSYSWNFGDLTPPAPGGAGPTIIHDYQSPLAPAYSVKLTTFFHDGSRTEKTRSLVVTAAPTTAAFQYNTGFNEFDEYGNPLGLTIRFFATAAGTSGNTFNYAWEFGDGAQTLQGGKTPEHYYAQPGTYIARLTVTEITPAGQPAGTAAAELPIVVKNKPPVPVISTPACAIDGCAFNGASSSDDGLGASGIVSWSWDFGDGNVATGAHVTHRYLAGGRPYPVTLTVTDAMGASASATRLAAPMDQPPVAQFEFSCSGLTCDFDGSGSRDDNGTLVHAWSFAGQSNLGETTSHTFAATGRYSATLTVTDGAGLVSTAKRVVNVTSIPAVPAQRYVPLTPCRAFDSRTTDVPALSNGAPRIIDLVDTPCRLPPGTAAVALTATVVAPPGSGEGFLQLGPNSGMPLDTSVLNFSSGRTPRGNNAIVQLNGGSIRASTFAAGGTPVDVILDITGFFTSDPQLAGSALGFNVLPPCRLLDTRVTPPGLAAGTPLTLPVGGRCGAPPTARAAALNVVVAAASGEGNLRLFPADLRPPLASALNFQSHTVPHANGALASLSNDSTRALNIQLDVAATADVVVDSTGYFDIDAPLVYRPVAPCRAFDSRDPDSGESRLQSGVRRNLQIRGNCGVPSGAKAAAMNFSIIQPDGEGFLTAFPSDDDSDVPLASVINFTAGEPVIGNGAIVPLSGNTRDLSVYPFVATGSGLHMVVDVVGYFAPSEESSLAPKTADAPSAPRSVRTFVVRNPSSAAPMADHRYPTAHFEIRCTGLSCNFDASDSRADAGIASFQWNLAGKVAAGAIARHAFATAGDYDVALTVRDRVGRSSEVRRKVSVATNAPSAGQRFLPVRSCRLFDSRSSGTELRNGDVRTINVLQSACRWPAIPTAVALSATVLTSPGTGDGALQIGPARSASTDSAALRFTSDHPEHVTTSVVALTDGTFEVSVSTSGKGPLQLTLDATGIFTSEVHPDALGFQVLPSCRLLDTRLTSSRLTQDPRILEVSAGACNIPATARVAALHLAGTTASRDSRLALTTPGSPATPATLLPLRPTALPQSVSVLAELSSDAARAIQLQLDSDANADLLVDVTGYFAPDATLLFHPLTPCRAFDSLHSMEAGSQLADGAPHELQIQGNCGVPVGARAAMLRISVLSHDASGSLSAAASGEPAQARTAVMHFQPGQRVIANVITVGLADKVRDLAIRANARHGARLDLAVEVIGYFAPANKFLEH